MKNYITIIILFFATFNGTFFCQAQSPFLKKVVRVDNKLFVCHKMGNDIYVYNSKNIDNLGPGNLPRDASLSSINFDSLKKLKEIFHAIFTKPELEELTKEGEMSVQFVINNKGKILQLAFILSENTKITPEQLSSLEDAIKNEITFSFKDDSLKDVRHIIFIQKILFKELNKEKSI